MTASVLAKLERLMNLGEPVRVTRFPPEGPFVLLVLTNAADESLEVDTRLTDTEAVVWHLLWQIVGCLVERVKAEPEKQTELLGAAKGGLGAVLDARLRQIEG